MVQLVVGELDARDVSPSARDAAALQGEGSGTLAVQARKIKRGGAARRCPEW